MRNGRRSQASGKAVRYFIRLRANDDLMLATPGIFVR